MESKVTKKGTLRKRAPADKIGKTVPISTSLATASDADKMLIKMKEEGKTWAEIREAWKKMTGEETKSSTLPNRYSRLKTNLMTLQSGDGTRLTAAYAVINEEIETAIAHLQAQKWARIQDLMRSKGSKEKYTSAFLQKKYEELLENPEPKPKPVFATKDGDPAPLAVIPTNHRESTNSNRSSVVFPNYPESTSSDTPSEDEEDARAGIASRDSEAVLLEEIKDEDDMIVIKDEDEEELKDPSILKTEKL